MKLAIVCSHPIQYYAPWFRELGKLDDLTVRVFYLWDRQQGYDRGFQENIHWDVPLLEGYEHCFVKNISSNPGTHHWGGLNNPSLIDELVVFGPEALLIYGYNYKSLVSLIALWRNRSPMIFRGDSHRLCCPGGVFELAKRIIISIMFRKFSAFLYVGEANKEYFRYFKVSDDKLFFSPHSVDNARFISEADRAEERAMEMRSELGIPSDHLVVLFSGKFEEKKRPLDLLHAWRSLRPRGASLLFVGSGALNEDLERVAQDIPYVYFLPFQNQSTMPSIYSLSNLVVLPSYGKYETWGLTVNEAMCMKRPCLVSSHVGCARDLVHDGQTGYVFQAGNVSDLQASLSKMLSSPDVLERMGQNAFEHIQHYSYRQATEGLMKALAHLNKE